MAKKRVLKLSSFHGGLNSYATKRDIKDTEISQSDNARLDSLGSLKTQGASLNASADIMPTGTYLTNVKDGYGVYSFSSDYDMLEEVDTTGNGTPDTVKLKSSNLNTEGTDYTVVQTDINSQIRDRRNDLTFDNAIYDSASATNIKPHNIYREGVLRTCDGNFSNDNGGARKIELQKHEIGNNRWPTQEIAVATTEYHNESIDIFTFFQMFTDTLPDGDIKYNSNSGTTSSIWGFGWAIRTAADVSISPGYGKYEPNSKIYYEQGGSWRYFRCKHVFVVNSSFSTNQAQLIITTGSGRWLDGSAHATKPSVGTDLSFNSDGSSPFTTVDKVNKRTTSSFSGSSGFAEGYTPHTIHMAGGDNFSNIISKNVWLKSDYTLGSTQGSYSGLVDIDSGKIPGTSNWRNINFQPETNYQVIIRYKRVKATSGSGFPGKFKFTFGDNEITLSESQVSAAYLSSGEPSDSAATWTDGMLIFSTPSEICMDKGNADAYYLHHRFSIESVNGETGTNTSEQGIYIRGIFCNVGYQYENAVNAHGNDYPLSIGRWHQYTIGEMHPTPPTVDLVFHHNPISSNLHQSFQTGGANSSDGQLFLLMFQAAGSGTWQAGTYKAGYTYVYKGGQESDIKESSDSVTFSSDGIPMSFIVGGKILSNPEYAYLLNPGVIKIRFYIKGVDDITGSWYSVSEIDLEKGQVRWPNLSTSLYKDLKHIGGTNKGWAVYSDYRDGANANQGVKLISNSDTKGILVSDNLRYKESGVWDNDVTLDIESGALNSFSNYHKDYNVHHGPPIIPYSYFSGRTQSSQLLKVRYGTSTIFNRTHYIANFCTLNTDNTIDKIYPDRIMKSVIDSYDAFPENNFLDLVNMDADSIVKLEHWGDRLLVFKTSSLYIINTSKKSEFLETKYKVSGISTPAGSCRTHEGIVFANNSGCYLFNDRGLNNLTGRKLQTSNWSDFVGSSPKVGYDVSGDNLIVITNNSSNDRHSFVFNFKLKSWVKSEDVFPSSTTAHSNMVTIDKDNLVTYCVGGSSTFQKWRTDDDGDFASASTLDWRTKDFDFGFPSVDKIIHKVYIRFKGNNSNLVADYAINGLTSYSTLGTVTDANDGNVQVVELKQSPKIKCRSICIKISGTDTKGNLEFEGIDIIFSIKRPK